MARLQEQFLERVESLADRVLDVVGQIEAAGVSRRIVDQLAAAGTSVGANVFEADEAMSRADFVKCMAIAAKELSETRYWLRLAARRNWVKPARLGELLQECDEVRRVFGTIIKRSRKPRTS